MEAKNKFNDLVDTIIDMLSESESDRLVAEYAQLIIRRKKLLAYFRENKSSMKEEEISIFDKQLRVMSEYANVLVARSKIMGVKLPFIK